MAHLSIIVPVYAAENCLLELWQRLKLAIEAITPDFEVLLIDDFSKDHSWQIIQELACIDHRIKGIKLSRNFGQHYAITAGLDHCTGDFAVVMDCDLQDQPEEIIKLYQKAQQGYDIVLARRMYRQDPISKKILSWFFYKIFNYFLDHQYDGRVANFRLISKKVVLSFRCMRENLRFFGQMLSWMGYKTAYVDVIHAQQKTATTYSFKKLYKLGSETIIAYSDKPLRLAIRVGILITCFAFSYAIYLIFNAFIYHTKISDLMNLTLAIYFIGGMIIWMLGIIGIYLGKTFDETKKRPLYIIESATIEF